jgi:hypothetical protein
MDLLNNARAPRNRDHHKDHAMPPLDAQQAAAVTLLQATGMSRWHYLPLYVRAMWSLGIKVRPPHFVSARRMFVIASLSFALGWGVGTWLLAWRHTVLSGITVAGIAVLGGLLFGAFMTVYYGYGRRTHKLPAWKSLG